MNIVGTITTVELENALRNQEGLIIEVILKKRNVYFTFKPQNRPRATPRVHAWHGYVIVAGVAYGATIHLRRNNANEVYQAKILRIHKSTQ